MAKGLRSRTGKINRSTLRSRIFGQIEKARKERLSAKLLELAARPRLGIIDDNIMISEELGMRQSLLLTGNMYA